jgi:branched-chain amino acid transport system ATP-binding protein
MSVQVQPSAGTVASGDALLELDDVHAGYGPFRALFGVSFRIKPGSTLALLGANGAGKTTVVRVVSGLIRPTSGSVRFEGRELTPPRRRRQWRQPWRRPPRPLSAYKIARLGITQAPEGRSVFASLTVEENLVLSFRAQFGRAGMREPLDEAFAMFPRLSERRRQLAGSLSGGEQRMLSLARVLAASPKLLVTDELSLGLAPVVIDDVYRTLNTIRERGVALLIVEQHVKRALSLADEVVVLAKGRVALSGPAGELSDLSETLLPAAHGDGTLDGRDRPERP